MLQWDKGGGSGGGSECVVLLPPHLNGELEGENARSMCIKLNAFLFSDFFLFFFLGAAQPESREWETEDH